MTNPISYPCNPCRDGMHEPKSWTAKDKHGEEREMSSAGCVAEVMAKLGFTDTPERHCSCSRNHHQFLHDDG